jgi:hypothetical protein
VIALLPRLWTLLFSSAPSDRHTAARRVDPVRLQQARAAIRSGDFDRARTLLADWDETVWVDGACLNVLGVLAVAESDWKRAARLWRAAVRANRAYQPPRQNLRRYFELFQFGRSSVAIALGDEPGLRDGEAMVTNVV